MAFQFCFDIYILYSTRVQNGKYLNNERMILILNIRTHACIKYENNNNSNNNKDKLLYFYPYIQIFFLEKLLRIRNLAIIRLFLNNLFLFNFVTVWRNCNVALSIFCFKMAKREREKKKKDDFFNTTCKGKNKIKRILI